MKSRRELQAETYQQLGIADELPLTRDPLEWGPPNFTIAQARPRPDAGSHRGALEPERRPDLALPDRPVDNLIGKHSIKAGVTVMRRNNVFIETLTARGDSFGGAPGGAYTGDGLVDFMLGHLSAASALEPRRYMAGRISSGTRPTYRTTTR